MKTKAFRAGVTHHNPVNDLGPVQLGKTTYFPTFYSGPHQSMAPSYEHHHSYDALSQYGTGCEHAYGCSCVHNLAPGQIAYNFYADQSGPLTGAKGPFRGIGDTDRVHEVHEPSESRESIRSKKRKFDRMLMQKHMHQSHSSARASETVPTEPSQSNPSKLNCSWHGPKTKRPRRSIRSSTGTRDEPIDVDEVSTSNGMS